MRVLVTGASSGLGAALAEGLAQRGAVVGLCARRENRLAEVLERVREHSPDSRSWTVDLADIAGLDTFATQATEELGGIDVLVNNAGIPKRRWAWQHRPDEITDVLRLNVESPIRLTGALLGELARNEGHVVMIGSVAARLAPPNEAVYSASNDSSLSDIEPLEPTAIVGAVLDALGTGTTETFVPGWFADLPPVKAGDLDGFLQGSVDYTRSRLEALGLNRPSGPGTPT
jgi:nucleoside-diphosphate-sugar epimerase